MKRRLILTAAALMMVATSMAQTDPVLFEIAGTKIHRSEFVRDMRNNVTTEQLKNSSPTERMRIVGDYANLYFAYRLKLHDAYMLGMDTTPELVKELSTYRAELSAPYLIDSATLQQLLTQAYERNRYALHASHILVRVPQGSLPADTLRLYNEAMDIYNQLQAGADFREIALERSRKEIAEMYDAETKREPYDGELGMFTVFDMVYPFENAAYALKEGEISLPVRSQYGYHIIKLWQKVPYFGNTTLQHIWISESPSPEQAKSRIDRAYEQLKAGENFSVVAQNYSDDRSTANNGGLLQDMPLREIPTEFAEQLSTLNEGQYSQPFHSAHGWHIIYVVRKDHMPMFEEMVPYYKQRMARDSRSQVPQKKFIDQSKKRYNLIDHTQEYTTLGKGRRATRMAKADLNATVNALTDSVWRKRWHYNDSMDTDPRPLFTIGTKSYTNADLLRYIETHQRFVRTYDRALFAQESYNDFMDAMTLQYADSQLENENPEFAALVKEYRNGLMIFAYNDQMIWAPAFRDTAGFNQYFETTSKLRRLDNPNDSVYFWNQRAQLTILHIADSTCLLPKKAQKLMSNYMKKPTTLDVLRSRVAAKLSKNCQAEVPFTVDSQLCEQYHQMTLNSDEWQAGIYSRHFKAGYTLIAVRNIMPRTLKSRTEARGFYINDYQTFLEKQNEQLLTKKYNAKKNQEAIDNTRF